MATDRQVGATLEQRRKEHDWSQDEMARRLTEAGLAWSQVTLSKVERGERAVRLTEAAVVAEVLKIEPFELLPSSENYRHRARRSIDTLQELDVALGDAYFNVLFELEKIQAYQFASVVSSGQNPEITLHIRPYKLLARVGTETGGATPEDVFYALGLADSEVESFTGRVAADTDRYFQDGTIPAYAPANFEDQLAEELHARSEGDDEIAPEYKPLMEAQRQRIPAQMIKHAAMDDLVLRTFPFVRLSSGAERAGIVADAFAGDDWPVQAVEGLPGVDPIELYRQVLERISFRMPELKVDGR